MQQLAWGQEIKHLMVLETTGFRIHDMEMKRRSKIDRHWMSAMPITCTSTKRRQRVKDCQSAHSIQNGRQQTVGYIDIQCWASTRSIGVHCVLRFPLFLGDSLVDTFSCPPFS